MFTLILFNIGVHIAQLLFDDNQTLVDEVRGIDRHRVLVIDGILIIHGNQRIDHILRTRNRDILQRQVDDGCRFAGQGCLQVRLIGRSRGFQIGLANMNICTEIFICII